MARVCDHWSLEVSDPVSERWHWQAAPGRSVAGRNDRVLQVQKPVRGMAQCTPGTEGSGTVLGGVV